VIRNNLAVLLAERSLKITRVARDTAISRNTITSTAQNDGKMIQLETINKLCQYLDVNPEQFFEYLPFDISGNFSLNHMDYTLNSLGGDFPDADSFADSIRSAAVITEFDMDSFISISSVTKNGNNTVTTLDCKIEADLSDNNSVYGRGKSFKLTLIPDDDKDDYHLFKRCWGRTPAGFKTDIQAQFTDKIKNIIDSYIFNQMTDEWEGVEPLFFTFADVSLNIALD